MNGIRETYNHVIMTGVGDYLCHFDTVDVVKVVKKLDLTWPDISLFVDVEARPDVPCSSALR